MGLFQLYLRDEGVVVKTKAVLGKVAVGACEDGDHEVQKHNQVEHHKHQQENTAHQFIVFVQSGLPEIIQILLLKNSCVPVADRGT